MTRSRATCRASPPASGSPAFALTEPGRGSDAAALQTRAERDGDGYGLERHQGVHHRRGRRRSLRRHGAHRRRGPRGISAFLVEAALAGGLRGRAASQDGLAGSWTGELVLDGVRVPGREPARRGGRGVSRRHGGAGQRTGRHQRRRWASRRARRCLDATSRGGGARGRRCRRDAPRRHPGANRRVAPADRRTPLRSPTPASG